MKHLILEVELEKVGSTIELRQKDDLVKELEPCSLYMRVGGTCVILN